jgi:hypothetical protein
MKATERSLTGTFASVAVLGLVSLVAAPAVAGPTHPAPQHAPPAHVSAPAHPIARPAFHPAIAHPVARPIAHPIAHPGHPVMHADHPDMHPGHAYHDIHDIHHFDAPRHAFFVNPHHYNAWAWHHGVAWYPDHHYWGGYFWGPIAVGYVVTPAVIVPIAPDSPGHQVLASYDLIETPCNDNVPQVDLYGPDGSMVCANPNNEVPAGRYNIDASTLSLAQTDEE